jgi:hypothetical protein
MPYVDAVRQVTIPSCISEVLKTTGQVNHDYRKEKRAYEGKNYNS